MIFRRAKQDHSLSEFEDKRHRRRRKSEPEEETRPAAESDQGERPLGEGPYDADEIGFQATADDIDFGGLVIRPRPDIEVGAQLTHENNVPPSLTLIMQGSAVELLALAAPRSSDLWPELRRETSAEVTRVGGVVTESQGSFGPELKLVLPVTDDQGNSGTQTSRVVGIDGPRWFLRARFFGAAAQDPEGAKELEGALRDVLVVRGKQPMRPREVLPLRLPDNLKAQLEADEGAAT